MLQFGDWVDARINERKEVQAPPSGKGNTMMVPRYETLPELLDLDRSEGDQDDEDLLDDPEYQALITGEINPADW